MYSRNSTTRLLHSHKQGYHLSPALSAALALHVAIVFILSLTPVKHLKTQDKTVPVVELSLSPSTAAVSSKDSIQPSAKSRPIVSSRKESSHQVRQAETKRSVRKATSKSAPELPKIAPQVRKQTNALDSNSAPSTRSKALREDQLSKVQQKSTRDTTALNDYEIALLQRLAEEKLYDSYHSAAEKAGLDQIQFELSLTLFANGAIKSAVVERSSGLGRIDSLAIQTAYNASPYPRPPKEDARIGFTYTVPVRWLKED